MKFGRFFLSEQVPEWQDAYLKYSNLKQLLSPAKVIQRRFMVELSLNDGQVRHPKYSLFSIDDIRLSAVLTCLEEFSRLLRVEVTKIDLFFAYKMHDLSHRLQLLSCLFDAATVIGSDLPRSICSSSSRHKNLNKQQLRILFKEAILLQQFVKLNEKGVVKILKKQRKMMEIIDVVALHFHLPFACPSELTSRITSLSVSYSFLVRNSAKLSMLLYSTEALYLDSFYPEVNARKKGRQELRAYSQPKLLSRRQELIYGLLCGVSLLLLLYIVLMFIEIYLKQSMNDSEIRQKNFTLIFPLFRGNGLCIALYWLLAWNVHGWLKHHINYRLVFKFNHHFSQLYSILQVAAFFTLVFLLSFVWYLLLNTAAHEEGQSPSLMSLINWIDMDLLPLFGWVALLGYTFFPVTCIHRLNGQGRLYFFRLLLDVLKTPFIPMDFRISWMTNVISSLAGPLKDLETTVCFYYNKFSSQPTDFCVSSARIQHALLSVVPSMYRFMQCCRQGYDQRQFWWSLPFLNAVKYLFSIITSLLSYKYTLTKDSSDLVLWFVFGGISTFYSFSWDVCVDWGLLSFGGDASSAKFLSRRLFYGGRSLYWLAMASNLFLRVVWVLNISLGLAQIIDEKIGVPGIFKFFIYLLELFRRCQWNFFRVEMEHLKNCQKYQAVVAMPPKSVLHLPPPHAIQPSSPDSLRNQGQLIQTTLQQFQLHLAKGVTSLQHKTVYDSVAKLKAELKKLQKPSTNSHHQQQHQHQPPRKS